MLGGFQASTSPKLIVANTSSSNVPLTSSLRVDLSVYRIGMSLK